MSFLFGGEGGGSLKLIQRLISYKQGNLFFEMVGQEASDYGQLCLWCRPEVKMSCSMMRCVTLGRFLKDHSTDTYKYYRWRIEKLRENTREEGNDADTEGDESNSGDVERKDAQQEIISLRSKHTKRLLRMPGLRRQYAMCTDVQDRPLLQARDRQ